MSIVYNSTKTADTVNRAIDNSMGTTTTTQGAVAAGKIITEDLQPVVQCTGGYTNPITVKSISGVPPVSFHAVEGNLKSWSIYGNTVEGASVGEKTTNLFDKNKQAGTIYVTETATRYGVEISASAGTYTVSGGSSTVFIKVKYGTTYGESHSTLNYTITLPQDGYILIYAESSITYLVDTIMINTGETALPYEPYGYKVPIECAGITYNCYISDVLRKSVPVERKRKSKKAVNDTTVYDIMDSTGTVTRNVDTDGTPLETPTTETYTAPTITTIWGYNEFDVDTTVTPSNVIVEYYDN